jgi:hypothetical protein
MSSPEIVQRVKTLTSDWVVENGCLTRQVVGVEVHEDAPDQTSSTTIAVGPSPTDYSLPMAYRRLLTSIARARDVTECVKVRDAAVALRALAKMARNTAAERDVAEIRLRAERKVGEVCLELTKLQGTRGRNNAARADGRKTKASQLAAAGITVQQSKIWEKLAAIPSPTFEAALATAPSLSTRAVLHAAWKPSRTTATTSVDPVALRLWRRLAAFDDGMLDQEPSELLKALTPAMRERVCELAPRISAWLDRLPPTARGRKRTATVGASELGASR